MSGCFPSREGTKGCVTVRGEVWDKMFLLLFGRGVIRQILGDCFCFRKQCTDITHPRPSREGSFECYFLIDNERFEWFVSPLERGALKYCFLFVNEG